MSAHRLPVRVYYEDTDLAGVVYHANYLKFMERGRTEALRAAGVEQSRLKAETGVVFLVTRVEVDYRRPALFDDALIVETEAADIGRAAISMRQAVLRGDTPLVEALVWLVPVNARGWPTRIPPSVRAALEGL